jgi:hypothetical protein
MKNSVLHLSSCKNLFTLHRSCGALYFRSGEIGSEVLLWQAFLFHHNLCTSSQTPNYIRPGITQLPNTPMSECPNHLTPIPSNQVPKCNQYHILHNPRLVPRTMIYRPRRNRIPVSTLMRRALARKAQSPLAAVVSDYNPRIIQCCVSCT